MPAAIAVSPAVDLKGVLPGSKGPDGADPGGDLRGGARRLSGRPARRRHVLLLHRAQPQAAAGRAARFRHPHDLPDRACRRRRLGDGDAGGAALCDPVDQGASSAARPIASARAPSPARDNPYGAVDRRQSRTTAASACPTWIRASAASSARPGRSAMSRPSRAGGVERDHARRRDRAGRHDLSPAPTTRSPISTSVRRAAGLSALSRDRRPRGRAAAPS